MNTLPHIPAPFVEIPGSVKELWHDDTDCRFNARHAAGDILEKLYGLEVLATEGGARAWGIPAGACAPEWTSPRFNGGDEDRYDWAGVVQATTHILADGSEVAVMHSYDIDYEFDLPERDDEVQTSSDLLDSWLHYTAGSNELVETGLGMATEEVIAEAKRRRELARVLSGYVEVEDLPDLRTAALDSASWAIRVPVRYLLEDLYGLVPPPVPANHFTTDWTTDYDAVTATRLGDRGVEVAYLDPAVPAGETVIPGLTEPWNPVTSWGLLVAAVGSTKAAADIANKYDEPSLELLEAIRAAAV